MRQTGKSAAAAVAYHLGVYDNTISNSTIHLSCLSFYMIIQGAYLMLKWADFCGLFLFLFLEGVGR